MRIDPNTVHLRTTLQPGDIGELTRLHGAIYHAEYAHGIAFEALVAAGLAEFRQQFDPALDRIWICEGRDGIAGSLFLMHRNQEAQLRYFLLTPAYRGFGLGRRLMTCYMEALRDCGYRESFLWTTNELIAAAALYRAHGFRLVEERPSTRFGKALVEQKYVWREGCQEPGR